MSKKKQVDVEQARLQLAEKLLFELKINHTRTVPELSKILGAEEAVIEQLLDEYLVHDGKTITHEGPGKGGGWTPQPEEEEPDVDREAE